MGRWDKYLSAFGRSEFFYPITTIGEFPLIAAGLLLLFRLVGAVQRRSFSLIKPDLTVVAVIAISLLFYLINVAARWIEPANHELPCFEFCIMSLCLWGYCWWRSWLLGIFLLFATAVRWLFYTISVLHSSGITIFDFYYTVAFFLVCASVLFVCAMSYLRSTPLAGKALWSEK